MARSKSMVSCRDAKLPSQALKYPGTSLAFLSLRGPLTGGTVKSMMENLERSMVGDTSVRGKYLDTMRRSEHLEPEKDLLLAILEDAIYSYRKYRRARGRERKRQFREAEHWIMGGGDDWIFSFNNICELLGLAPDYIRRGLRESDAKSDKPVG